MKECSYLSARQTKEYSISELASDSCVLPHLRYEQSCVGRPGADVMGGSMTRAEYSLRLCRRMGVLIALITGAVACGGSEINTESTDSAHQHTQPASSSGAKLVIESVQGSPSNQADCGLPSSSETVDIFGVPKKEQIRVYVKLQQPVYADVSFSIQSEDATAAEIRTISGRFYSVLFLTIKAGQSESNKFILEGVRVDKTRLEIDKIVDDRPEPEDDIIYPRHFVPIYVWDVDDEDIVDYNALGDYGGACYEVDNSPAIVSDMPQRIYCGERADAVAADAASLQLVRLKSGGAGRACFSIIPGNVPVATQTAYLGKFSDPIAGGPTTDSPTENVAAVPYLAPGTAYPFYWAFGTYTPPEEFFEEGETERTVEVEMQYMPQSSDGTPIRSHTTAIRKNITIRRPPIILIHGLFSNIDAWKGAFRKRTLGWAVDDEFNYQNSVAIARSAPELDARIEELLEGMRSGAVTGGVRTAATKADLIGHSLGGVIARKTLSINRKSRNFNKGNVRKSISLASPHRGTQIANLMINLHDEYFDTATGEHSFWLSALELAIGPDGGNLHQGALCDLAEGSLATRFDPVGGVETYALTASKGDIGELDGSNDGISILGFDDEQVDPYVFTVVNDTQVALVNQHMNSALHFTNNADIDHGGIKNDQDTADFAFKLLDRSGVVANGFTNGMPGQSSTGDGIPLLINGRGIDPATNRHHDAMNYERQCAQGGPMNGVNP